MPHARQAVLNTALTIPNLLTSVRLLMAIVAAVLFVAGSLESVAVTLCLLGVILDAIDGWYARKFEQCSRLGKFLDPLADKVLMTVVYGVIAINLGSVVVWALFALVTCRDLIVTVSRSLSIRKHGSAYPAGRVGKAKMIVQSIAGIAILWYAYVLDAGFNVLHYPAVGALLVVTLLSFVSAGKYLWPGNLALAGPSKRSR